MNPQPPNITADMFEAYERIRIADETDMDNLPIVCHLTGLSMEEVQTIQQNHRSLSHTYDLIL